MNEEIILRGETPGDTTSGTVSLDSDIFHSPVSFFRLPRGMIVFVTFKKVSGEGETLFTLQYANDVTIDSPKWRAIEREKLASKGEFAIEEVAVILHSLSGKEGIRVIFEQPTAAKAYIELGVKLMNRKNE